MYTKHTYSFKDMLRWTRHDLLKFLVIGITPVILYAVFDLRWLHFPWLPIALVGTAVAFIIGFKNNASYDRLWEARKIWGGIVNTSRSFTMMVGDYINNDQAKAKLTEEELIVIRKTLVHRHIAWMTAHRYTLREQKPWESFRIKKTNREYQKFFKISEHTIPFEEAIRPYLSEHDFKFIQGKSNAATHLLSLQSKNLRELKEQGLIWEFSFLQMEGQIVELYSLQGKNERIKNFPYPRQFATLNYYFVWTFIFLLPFGVMYEFDKIGNNLLHSFQDIKSPVLQLVYEFISANFEWLSVPFSMVISWVFYTMERIGEVSENPFEGNSNDVPITTMSRSIEIDIREMIGEKPEDIPDPIPMQYDIQM